MPSPDLHLDAATLVWDAGQLHAEAGTLLAPAGRLTFESADVDLALRVATLSGVHLYAAERCGTGELLAADQLRLTADGHLHADSAELHPCPCPTGAELLSMRARSVDLVPDRYAILHGGTIRLLGVPVLPVPWWRVALDPDAVRLRLPEVGVGTNGWSVAWEAEGGVARSRWAAGAAWREDRGVRALADLHGPAGGVRGEVGWDEQVAEWRGAVVGQGGVDERVRLAWDLDAASDRDYAADYALGYAQRGVAWRDNRVVGELGPVRAAARLADDHSVGRILDVGAQTELLWGGPARGGAIVVPSLDASLVGESGLGAAAAAVPSPVIGSVVPRFGGQILARASSAPGWLHLDATARGAGWVYANGVAGLAGRAQVGAAVPMWSPVPGGRVQWWPGGVAEVGATLGEGYLLGEAYVAPDPDDAMVTTGLPPAPPWAAGPSLGADLVAGDLVASAQLRSTWSAEGYAPSVRLSASTSALRVRGSVDRMGWQVEGATPLQAGAVTLTPRLGSARVLPAQGSTLWIGQVGLDAGWQGWSAGAALTGDLDAVAWSGASARVAYTDGCTELGLGAAFAPDRPLPDLTLRVTLRR